MLRGAENSGTSEKGAKAPFLFGGGDYIPLLILLDK